MNREKTMTLTGVSAFLWVFLTWAFADHMWDLSHLWESDAILSSTLWTYVFLAAIIAAGMYQASRASKDDLDHAVEHQEGYVEDPQLVRNLLTNVTWAIFWMPVRFFVGLEFGSAGEEKLRSSAWMDGGTALKGFWTNAVAIPEKGHPAITYGWYRDFLQYMLNHEWYTWFAKVIAIGEFLVGIGLIVGALVGIAAFFGTILNLSFGLAGSASTNPILFGIGVLLVFAWKIAGHWGLDRFLLPTVGVPWMRREHVVRRR